MTHGTMCDMEAREDEMPCDGGGMHEHLSQMDEEVRRYRDRMRELGDIDAMHEEVGNHAQKMSEMLDSCDTMMQEMMGGMCDMMEATPHEGMEDFCGDAGSGMNGDGSGMNGDGSGMNGDGSGMGMEAVQ